MSQQFVDNYAQLQQAFEQFTTGKLSAPQLKHATAPLGIYQQRDGNFMTRIRITGGGSCH